MTDAQRSVLVELTRGSIRNALSSLLLGSERFNDFRSRLQRDLALGITQRLDMDAERMACGEELGDEGPFYFFDSGNRQILFLAGPWLYDPHVVPVGPESDEEETWFREFTLIRAPSTGTVFELHARAPALITAERILPARMIPFLGDSALIEASWDSLELTLSNPRSGP